METNRVQVIRVLGLYTGNDSFKKHLHNIAIAGERQECKLCGEVEETAYHTNFESEALTRWRIEMLGIILSMKPYHRRIRVKIYWNILK